LFDEIYQAYLWFEDEAEAELSLSFNGEMWPKQDLPGQRKNHHIAVKVAMKEGDPHQPGYAWRPKA